MYMDWMIVQQSYLPRLGKKRFPGGKRKRGLIGPPEKLELPGSLA